jgi:hypothetical protein
MSTAARGPLDDAEALRARATCAAASLKNPSHSSVPGTPTQAIELSALLVGQDPIVSRTNLAAVDTGLTNPTGQAAGAQAEALGHHIAGGVTLRDLSKESGGGPIFLSPGLS